MSNTGVPDDVIKLVMTGTCHLLSLGSALCDGNMSVARREERKTNDGNLQLPLSCASYTRLLYGKGNDHASLGYDINTKGQLKNEKTSKLDGKSSNRTRPLTNNI